MRAYGIDEIALVPGGRTVDPAVTDSSWTLGGVTREIPIIASAMDGVVDVGMCVELTKQGALGVLNLEGVQCRYDDPNPALDRIAAVGKDEFVPLMQELYSQPVREDLIRKRIAEIKERGGIAAVSATPVAALKFGKAIAEAGADLFFVQATVVSTEHIGPEGQESLDLEALCRDFGVPVIIGAGMAPGLSGLLVGLLEQQVAVVDEVHVAVHGTAGPACARQHHAALGSAGVGWHDGARGATAQRSRGSRPRPGPIMSPTGSPARACWCDGPTPCVRGSWMSASSCTRKMWTSVPRCGRWGVASCSRPMSPSRICAAGRVPRRRPPPAPPTCAATSPSIASTIRGARPWCGPGIASAADRRAI